MQQTFATVAGKVAETIDSYAKEHGYTLVLDGGNQQVPVVLYANQSTDITKAVIDAYNTKSGIPAPERPAAPGTTAPLGSTTVPLTPPVVMPCPSAVVEMLSVQPSSKAMNAAFIFGKFVIPSRSSK
jgi:hypothetical protein